MGETKVKLILSNGDHFSTWINLDKEQAKKYYLHRYLNMSSGEKEDVYKQCVNVKILAERDKVPHYESKDY